MCLEKVLYFFLNYSLKSLWQVKKCGDFNCNNTKLMKKRIDILTKFSLLYLRHKRSIYVFFYDFQWRSVVFFICSWVLFFLITVFPRENFIFWLHFEKQVFIFFLFCCYRDRKKVIHFCMFSLYLAIFCNFFSVLLRDRYSFKVHLWLYHCVKLSKSWSRVLNMWEGPSTHRMKLLHSNELQIKELSTMTAM